MFFQLLICNLKLGTNLVGCSSSNTVLVLPVNVQTIEGVFGDQIIGARNENRSLDGFTDDFLEVGGSCTVSADSQKQFHVRVDFLQEEQLLNLTWKKSRVPVVSKFNPTEPD